MKLCSMAGKMAVASLLGLVLFTACSDESSSTSFGINDGEKESLSVLNELKTTFSWLYLIYIYGHERDEIAESYDVYVGKGTEADAKNKFGQPSCTEEYYDVCYMFNQMRDPYTRYYSPLYAPAAIEHYLMPPVEAIFIGAEYAPYDDQRKSYEVIEASENAKEDELHVGDIFVGDEVSALIPKDLTDTIEVSFNVTRGETTAKVNVRTTRARRPTVHTHFEKTESGDSIPVILIREFDAKTVGGGTFSEFAEALEQTKGFKSLILDLRDNGGGDTEHCNAAASEFLSEGDTTTIDVEARVYGDSEGKHLFQKLDTNVVVTTKDGSAKDRYVVILANANSASCAELMLSAIAVNKKSPVVGTLTYGKQIAQYLIYTDPENENAGVLPDPEGLAVITAIYAYDKNWEKYHDTGIVPDFEIADRHEQMKKAVELAVEGTATRTAGYGTERLGHFSKAADLPDGNSLRRDMKMRYTRIKW